LAPAGSQITLDLEDVYFIDSAGLHAILACAQECKRHRSKFALTSGTAQARRLFELSGYLDQLPFVSAA
jgi:anti-anti-sigma factor